MPDNKGILTKPRDMKKAMIALMALVVGFQSFVSAQADKDIKSKISRVTLYSQGAQIERVASFDLQQGKILLSFKNPLPYINKESIRGDGDYTILNVQFQNDYINELEKDKEINDLNANIQHLLDKIEDEGTGIKILNEKLEFLKSNKSITGKEQSISPRPLSFLVEP
jgi:hypothetical protein